MAPPPMERGLNLFDNSVFAQQIWGNESITHGCVDTIRSRTVSFGEYFYTDRCTRCQCRDSIPLICHQIQCAAPPTCTGGAVLRRDRTSCCEICVLVDGNPIDIHDGNHSSTIGLRIGAVLATLFLFCTLLCFTIYRFRKKGNLLSLRRISMLRRNPNARDSIDYCDPGVQTRFYASSSFLNSLRPARLTTGLNNVAPPPPYSAVVPLSTATLNRQTNGPGSVAFSTTGNTCMLTLTRSGNNNYLTVTPSIHASQRGGVIDPLRIPVGTSSLEPPPPYIASASEAASYLSDVSVTQGISDSSSDSPDGTEHSDTSSFTTSDFSEDDASCGCSCSACESGVGTDVDTPDRRSCASQEPGGSMGIANETADNSPPEPEGPSNRRCRRSKVRAGSNRLKGFLTRRKRKKNKKPDTGAATTSATTSGGHVEPSRNGNSRSHSRRIARVLHLNGNNQSQNTVHNLTTQATLAAAATSGLSTRV